MTTLPGGLTFSDGLITDIRHGETTAVENMLVAAGFIDIQVNGGWGHDFTADPASIWEVGRRLPETGVTSFLPTIVTAPYSVVEAAVEVLRSGPPRGYVGADPIGLHVEGPWISPAWRGAHNPEHLRAPDPSVARRWADSGVVRMVTIAPELPGATEVAEILSAAGVVVSAGHTGADFETATRALEGPWHAVTHLFNQMTGFQHREPGMVGAALLSSRLCGLIVDGLHSHPSGSQMAWSHLGPERTVLVTDAMSATGLGEGTYPLGDLEVTVGPDGPRTPAGDLAGSILTMDRAVANLTQWTSATVGQALTSASLAPATVIGAEDRGRLKRGMRADLVVLDHHYRVRKTMIEGAVVYRASGV
jgi:N-acetylglucosamine-6-phosphate deacetylase